jgi:mono/diheme cytochrome c family protein
VHRRSLLAGVARRAVLAACVAAAAGWVLLATGVTPRAQMMGGPGGHMGMGGHSHGMMGSGPMGEPGPANPVPATAGSIAAGHTLFMAHCSACHGAGAAGDGPAAGTFNPPPPDLRGVARMHTPGQIFLVITRGFNRMPAMGGMLSDTERWHVVNYLGTLAN